MATNEEKLDEAKRKADKAAAERSKAEEQKKTTAKTGNLFAPGTAFTTSALMRQLISPAPTGSFSLIGTIWTRFDVGKSIRKSGFVTQPPEDWQFKEGGVLISLGYPMNKNSWVQNGNSVTVEYNDNFLTVEFKIINPELMQGTGKNILGWEGPIELRRK
jgi:hypothetical protein